MISRLAAQKIGGCGRERQPVLTAVFCPGRRKNPRAGFKVELIPSHFADLTQPLTGQDQQYYENTVGPFELTRRLPHGCQLIVAEHFVARCLDTRPFDFIASVMQF